MIIMIIGEQLSCCINSEAHGIVRLQYLNPPYSCYSYYIIPYFNTENLFANKHI